MVFAFNAAGGAYWVEGDSTPPDEWHHVAGTIGKKGAHLYIDGYHSAFKDSTSYAVSTNNLYIGRYGSNYFDGSIADVRIYGRQLTQQEIAIIARNGWDAGEASRRVRSNDDHRLVVKLHAPEMQHQPTFVVDNWWNTSEPTNLFWDGDRLSYGSGYRCHVDEDNKKLIVQVNRRVIGSSHELFIDDNDSTGAGKIAMKQLSYEFGSIWVKNFSGSTLGNSTSGDWAFKIDTSNTSCATTEGVRTATEFKSAVATSGSYQSSSSSFEFMDYLVLDISLVQYRLGCVIRIYGLEHQRQRIIISA